MASELLVRLHQHRESLIRGFSKRYGGSRLVYYERFEDMISAITREKRLKKWQRDWKLNLIEASNPGWVDLAEGLGLGPAIPRR